MATVVANLPTLGIKSGNDARIGVADDHFLFWSRFSFQFFFCSRVVQRRWRVGRCLSGCCRCRSRSINCGLFRGSFGGKPFCGMDQCGRRCADVVFTAGVGRVDGVAAGVTVGVGGAAGDGVGLEEAAELGDVAAGFGGEDAGGEFCGDAVGAQPGVLGRGAAGDAILGRFCAGEEFCFGFAV